MRDGVRGAPRDGRRSTTGATGSSYAEAAMKRLATSVIVASVALALGSGGARAQCEGGVTVSGHYLANSAYVPGGCAYTNPTTPGQLYPSGAQPAPSTNPAQGSSRLPGQAQPSDLIPVN